MRLSFKITSISLTIFALSILSPIATHAAQWKQDSAGWQYQKDDTTNAKSQWVQDAGNWYHFDSNGYMETSWIQDAGNWYYLNSNGAMHTGWLESGGKWYYLHSNGVMAYNTIINDYQIGNDGAWIVAAEQPNYRILVSPTTNSSTSMVTCAITNNGTKPMIVYSDGSYLMDSKFESFNRKLKLLILDQKNKIQYLDLVTIEPNSTLYVSFEIIGDRTWYDKNTTISFCFKYDGKGYVNLTSYAGGTNFYKYGYIDD